MKTRAKKGVSAAVSVAILVPVIALSSMLLLSAYIQATASHQAGLNQASLAAEEGKKYLRATAFRGPSNQTLINLYGAGKLPITVDYLLVELQNDTILVEKSGNILTVNPGENVTIAPSQLDPRLASYDGDYWKAKREIKQLILHTSDGNSLYLSWGTWAGAIAATYSTNTATTTTQTSSTTTTITQTDTIVIRVRAASTTTSAVCTGCPRLTTTTTPPLVFSITCDAQANSYWSSLYATWYWSGWSISCSGSIQGGSPPYTITITSYCTISVTTSSTSFSGSCSGGLSRYGDPLQARVTKTVRDSAGDQLTETSYCTMYGSYYNPRTATC